MTFLGLTSSYSQDVKLVEVLPEGQGYIVLIGNTEYRALPPQKIRELQQTKEDLEVFKTKLNLAEQFIVSYKALSEKKDSLQAGILAGQIETDTKQIDFWKSQYDAEHALRLKRDAVFKSCTPKILIRICTK